MYFRYANDTFCVFGSETEPGEFFSYLNNMHPALRFTLEKENNFTLPFLDVLVLYTMTISITTVIQTHLKMQNTGGLCRFRYERFINSGFRFFDTRRDTQFLKAYTNHTI